MSSLSRQVFSAEDGPRKKLKICPEPPGNELSEYVFEKFCTMSVAKTATKNVRPPVNSGRKALEFTGTRALIAVASIS